MPSNKLKWYDWDGVGEIPRIAVVDSVKFRDGEIMSGDDLGIYYANTFDLFWTHQQNDADIIAYTLGEPLEGGE